MPATATDQTITLNNLPFHYRDWGGAGQSILLLHGLGSTSHIWDLTAPLLAAGHRVVALDQRGHGTSARPDDDYTFAALVGDLRQLVDELNLGRPLAVGHSWGASVVLAYGSLFPTEPAGLIMVDGGTFDVAARLSWGETIAQFAPAPIDGMPLDEFRRRISDFYFFPDGILNEQMKDILLANYETDAEGRIHSRLRDEHHRHIVRALWEQRPNRLYPQVQAPVLIIPARWENQGNPEWAARKQQTVAAAQDALAHIQVEWFDHSVHDIPLQHPRKLAATIATFASQL